MFRTKFKTGGVVINVLIAVAISLIVNFSYFVFMILQRTAQLRPEHPVSENSTAFAVLEVLFYMVVSFVLLTVFTHNLNENKIRSHSFPKRLLAAILLSVAVYFLAPYMNRVGDIHIMFTAKRLFNPMVLLKCSFTLVVVTLYGKIYELIVLQQRMTVENERLKTENLRSRYDVLINQMNPHFFFNSLNSLAMLVRENKNDDALVYIDRLSDTFRYIIQSGKTSMTTLRDEMGFLDAYKYLLELRYEGKLFIEADIPEHYLDRTLPSLTLQPLVENAVKHNTITRTRPLTVTISASGDWLLVSNPLQPKIDDSERGTGIGLKNIASRYRLLTDKDVNIIDDGKTFTVRLPLGAVESK
ncbi:MAG TPA: histidine kinase [Candidatus Tidjanibacter gallistercoris]|nr:histidine kinase [Candidatus Tidjanibacter gallistercoris]